MSIASNTWNSHYINGQWHSGEGAVFTSINPANNLLVWQGRNATAIEISQAFKSADKAAVDWAGLTLEERCAYLQNFARAVEKRRGQLAELISQETGKPFWESQTEVSSVIAKVAISIQAYQERNAEKSNSTAEATASLRYKPHGVVAVLGAFNFPAHLSNGHIVPALLAGNTIVYKPSELSPAVAALIMQCWHESDLPPGVINCIQGNSQTAKALLQQNIKGVFFTGSYQTGKKIHQQFAERPEIIIALEMGGNNPLVIDEVDDIDAAVYHTLLSTMITAGQRCTCARRLFIKNDAQGNAFLQRFTEICQTLLIGEYTQRPEPFIGPVIRLDHARMHLSAQQKLLDSGGKALLPMRLLKEEAAFLSPGIIDMSNARQISDEEIFAPLVQVYRYQDFEEAIVMANQTKYGLAAGLLSKHKAHYELFYKQIRSGLINWNRPTTGAASNLPFGGVGCSGNHRPSAYFAADYCSYPIASMESAMLVRPAQLLPGINLG
ncbi:succinylglutamic-5-semialdehyde dehydrogenase [Legionella birminghamensis]|uniref:N-succinylglutamate 5-semialdehyde dehydrogenase n=1 Tax=Legionella birminghamensis TaxID=28083 RepID=A0A378I9U8_9GAMM|nr:succinylglutamate-semialdehyde dehydrogenase [Legionella birminghamensis]KTC67920.1 succinylglutamic-5-semialdehyde dehydrogenase [Legionella birminghamensis]STX31371.1 succinylglutamic-5-semialdehyde dehydrogenase [Legionella birminghamensis]